MDAAPTTEGQQAASPQPATSTSNDVGYEAPRKEEPQVVDTRAETRASQQRADKSPSVTAQVSDVVETSRKTVDTPSVQSEKPVTHIASDRNDASAEVQVTAPVVAKPAPVIQMPIVEKPVVLPKGMTMIETASSASSSDLDSQQNTAELEKAREKRKLRRQAKEAASSASEPLQQVETQDSPK